MNVLVKKATIVCSSSPFHLQVKDILIIDGLIKEISDSITGENTQTISGNNLHISLGWLDVFADFAEPGNEYRETLETGANAAAAGGFTDVMLMPDTTPTVASKAQISFLIERAKALPIHIHPIGAVTKNSDGKELTEMYDMYAGGAVAFSDGRKAIQQSGILLKALQYVSAKNAVIIQIADDKSISEGSLMNEGIMSTKLGLPGNPAIAEELMIARDIALLRYTDSHLHITGVSTKKAIDLINEAKKEGLQLTCSVTPFHLYFSDEDLVDYETNLKVNPPLRTKEDVAALIDALRNGDIDCIASHHTPQCLDDKVCEFEYAKNGMVTLQTLYGTLNGLLNDPELLVKMFTETNREIFKLPIPTFETGTEASLTLFEPNTTYIFNEKDILSKSKNCPFIGKQMNGKVVGIINKSKVVLNN
ncbi:MAG: dihydroorotase [Ferruginibacter sp.]